MSVCVSLCVHRVERVCLLVAVIAARFIRFSLCCDGFDFGRSVRDIRVDPHTIESLCERKRERISVLCSINGIRLARPKSNWLDILSCSVEFTFS